MGREFATVPVRRPSIDEPRTQGQVKLGHAAMERGHTLHRERGRNNEGNGDICVRKAYKSRSV